ncbi:MAG: ion transporter [Clostridia bacterium]|nr:ion transporter [Clostridia bacterium]
MTRKNPPRTNRDKWYKIVFLADTKSGRLFDIILLVSIVLSVFVVMLDSVASLRLNYRHLFMWAEWIFTLLFTAEYLFRIFISRRPLEYVRSFYGIIDLLSVLPTYVSLLLVGSHYLLVIRILRMLRIFRILKLSRYLKASEVLQISLRQSKYKIIVFMEVILTTVVIMGSLMYLIEGPESGFSSIPRGIYWAIVTLTTVGFGDITPHTVLGQFFASIIMILGYAIIAVPTGILSTEMMKADYRMSSSAKPCSQCGHTHHQADAKYCLMCGSKLGIS